MTAADVHTPPPAQPPAADQQPPRSWPTALRLMRLHLTSRRVPIALVVLAACAVLLRIALDWHWIQGADPQAQQLPLVVETGTVTVLATTAREPFGEQERATGRWLPYLRLTAAMALTALAVAALAAGSTAADLPGGSLELLRNVAGLAGVSLLSCTLLGSALAWIGPLTYLAFAEYALAANWRTPWIWPARPPHDVGAALCATLAFTAGTLLITVRGARE